jgi:hypothetical protein
MTKRRFVLAVLIGLLVAGVDLHAQTFTAQIQQFWNLLRTGSISFTTLNVGTFIKMGAGTPDAGHPFSAVFNQNSNVQFLWWNNNAGNAASAEGCFRSDTSVGCISAQGLNVTTEPQRATLYDNCGVGCTNGTPGWDIVSCFSATPTGCSTRFFTNTTDGIAGERVRINSTGLLMANSGQVQAIASGNCAATSYAFIGALNGGLSWDGTTQRLCVNGNQPIAMDGSNVWFNSATLHLQSGGTNKFTWALNGATDGQLVMSNGAGAAGIGIDVATDSTLKLRGRALTAGTGNLDIGAKITAYNNLTTTGSGVPYVLQSGRGVAITSSLDANRCTFTPAADGTFEVWDYILVTTAGAATNMNGTIAFKTEEGTARSVAVVWQLAAGGTVTNVLTAAGTVGYYGVPIVIRAQAATAITVSTTGTPSTAVYNHECSIQQIS